MAISYGDQMLLRGEEGYAFVADHVTTAAE